MRDTVLGTTVKEKDLGVTISAAMKVSEQCGIAASNGNQIIGLTNQITFILHIQGVFNLPEAFVNLSRRLHQYR